MSITVCPSNLPTRALNNAKVKAHRQVGAGFELLANRKFGLQKKVFRSPNLTTLTIRPTRAEGRISVD
jgi:hypothetical protein